LYGPYDTTHAFLPLLTRSGGAIVNVLSLAAIAAVPLDPTYAMSKAAAFSLTQSLRAALASRGVSVHAVLAGPVDTDMGPAIDIPKAAPESVARAILDGVENGDEDIFPDPISAAVADGWRTGVAKALEREFAALAQAEPVAR
jgi:short-subunit dehydrogenase